MRHEGPASSSGSRDSSWPSFRTTKRNRRHEETAFARSLLIPEVRWACAKYNAWVRITAMLLEGKTGLIMGVANKRSIAWGIANALNQAGARLVLTYQSERLGENVRDLAPSLNNPLLVQCDVSSDEQIQSMVERV